jgi:hypothetical protein
MSQSDSNSQINEDVWRAWLKKNEDQDRFRYERRVKIMTLVAVFTTVSALLWKFAS